MRPRPRRRRPRRLCAEHFLLQDVAVVEVARSNRCTGRRAGVGPGKVGSDMLKKTSAHIRREAMVARVPVAELGA
eukprot:8511179-Pyramimonas_sp.AAC.2